MIRLGGAMMTRAIAAAALLAPATVAAAPPAAPGGVPRIRVQAPPEQACPSPADIERALGGAPPAGATPPPPSDPSRTWILATEPEGATLRLALRDPAGHLALERAIATAAPDCGAAADLVALVLDRYFREVSWTAPAAAAAPVPAGPTTRASAPPPIDTARRPAPAPLADPDREPAPAAPPPRLLLSLGPAWWSRGSSSVAGDLELRARAAGPISVGLAVLLPPQRAAEPIDSAGGQATLQVWPVLLRVLAERRRGPLSIGAGADTVLTYERAATTDIAMTANKDRVVLAAGLGLQASIALTARWRLLLDVAGHRTLLGRSFVVDGHGTVLDPSRFQGLVAVRVGWVLAP